MSATSSARRMFFARHKGLGQRQTNHPDSAGSERGKVRRNDSGSKGRGVPHFSHTSWLLSFTRTWYSGSWSIDQSFLANLMQRQHSYSWQKPSPLSLFSNSTPMRNIPAHSQQAPVWLFPFLCTQLDALNCSREQSACPKSESKKKSFSTTGTYNVAESWK